MFRKPSDNTAQKKRYRKAFLETMEDRRLLAADFGDAPEPLLPVHSDDYYYQLETANQPQQTKSIQKQNDEIEDDLLDLLAKNNSD